MKTASFLLSMLTTLFFANFSAISGTHRSYEPIVLPADSVNFFNGVPVQELFLLSYNAQTDSWHVVPFQIDEVDTSATPADKFFGNNDGIFNGSDELVFLTNALGDKAPHGNWASETDTIRVEFTFFDPLTGEMSYIYLYHSPSQNFSVPETYEMNYHSDTDQIETLHYRIGFNNTGQLGDVAIKSAIGGTEQDIFDRVKIRFYLSFFSYFFAAGEDSIIFDHAYAKTGPVRIIRNTVATFVYRPLFSGEQFTQTSLFYPWHGEFKLTNIPIGKLTGFSFVEIDEFRLSWDMNENATGMKLFTAHNYQGVTIDGDMTNDNFNPKCQPKMLNWTLASGNQGALLNIFYVPALGDSIRLYYHDATDGSTADFQPLFAFDSGDQMSYGDNGFSLFGNLEFYITSETTFDFLYYNFFVGTEFTPDSAAWLTKSLATPMQFSAVSQQYIPTNITDAGKESKINNFELLQNYPNPFNSMTTIGFHLPTASSVKLVIYDISGNLLTQIFRGNFPAGKHTLSWDGTNQNGQALPTGIYFYKLTTDFGVESRKLLLIR